MKIAIVGIVQNPICEPFEGGMESHTWWLAKKLIDRGHEVTLLASGDSDKSLGLVACCDQALNSLAQTQTARQRDHLSAYTRALQHICDRSFDVIHNNALHPLLLLSAADLPVPMVMTIHAPLYPELAAAVRYAATRNLNSPSKDSLAVAAVSKQVADQWRPLTEIDVVYNGIDTDSWLFSPVATPQLAMWYGRFVSEKAPHVAIQAALKAGYSIQVAGPISDRPYFNAQVKPLLSHPKVTYLGHLSHHKIKQALAKTSVLVNAPLWEEPYGMVYAEALAVGTPVAAFNRGAASEILTERCGVLVRQESIDALAAAIISASKLSRLDCRQRAESFCSLNAMVDSYEEIYQKLVHDHRKDERTILEEEQLAMRA